jgi:HNH endonuclease/AP2 domain
MNDIDSTKLRELLDYNPDTGVFIWKVKPCKNKNAGIEAGCISTGYRLIKVLKKYYQAHRLAWLYVYGEFPSKFIDHINGNPLDNRIVNLREATNYENSQNIYKPQSNNTSGFLGVTYMQKKKKWRAKIAVEGKRLSLGYYKSPEDAHKAYIEAKRKYHTFSKL